MKRIFLWFYCLPIGDAVFLILLSTGVFFLLREKFRDTLYRKAGVPVLLLLWIGVIILGTLGQRAEGGNPAAPVLTPFASYRAAFHGGSKELCRANFMNAVLFYPAGLLGCESLPGNRNRGWKVTLITLVFALGSIGIEYLQYRFALGLAEADDVIHNTLGAFLGAMACGGSLRWIFPSKKTPESPDGTANQTESI